MTRALALALALALNNDEEGEGTKSTKPAVMWLMCRREILYFCTNANWRATKAIEETYTENCVAKLKWLKYVCARACVSSYFVILHP